MRGTRNDISHEGIEPATNTQATDDRVEQEEKTFSNEAFISHQRRLLDQITELDDQAFEALDCGQSSRIMDLLMVGHATFCSSIAPVVQYFLSKNFHEPLLFLLQDADTRRTDCFQSLERQLRTSRRTEDFCSAQQMQLNFAKHLTQFVRQLYLLELFAINAILARRARRHDIFNVALQDFASKRRDIMNQREMLCRDYSDILQSSETGLILQDFGNMTTYTMGEDELPALFENPAAGLPVLGLLQNENHSPGNLFNFDYDGWSARNNPL